MTLLEIWAIVSLIIIICLIWYFVRYTRILQEELGRKQTRAYQIGLSQTKGDYAQILGTMSVLGEYKDLIILSTTSKQSSLDLIGIKEGSLDFIEFKKQGAKLKQSEKRIKQLIEEKQVRYRIIDVRLPKSVNITERRD